MIREFEAGDHSRDRITDNRKFEVIIPEWLIQTFRLAGRDVLGLGVNLPPIIPN
jgi:hypothetical protein